MQEMAMIPLLSPFLVKNAAKSYLQGLAVHPVVPLCCLPCQAHFGLDQYIAAHHLMRQIGFIVKGKSLGYSFGSRRQFTMQGFQI
jgi:hypothetical protein